MFPIHSHMHSSPKFYDSFLGKNNMSSMFHMTCQNLENKITSIYSELCGINRQQQKYCKLS